METGVTSSPFLLLGEGRVGLAWGGSDHPQDRHSPSQHPSGLQRGPERAGCLLGLGLELQGCTGLVAAAVGAVVQGGAVGSGQWWRLVRGALRHWHSCWQSESGTGSGALRVRGGQGQGEPDSVSSSTQSSDGAPQDRAQAGEAGQNLGVWTL